jgi:hypothetical protein
MDVGVLAHSSEFGTLAHNKELASEDSVFEWDVLDRMVVDPDPDTAHTEMASNPDFIDLTLSD